MNTSRTIPKGTFGISILIGICALAFAIFYAVYQNNVKSQYLKTEAAVTEVVTQAAINDGTVTDQKTAGVYVDYSYREKPHTHIFLSTGHTLAVGDSVYIWVHKESPETIALYSDNQTTFIAFLVLGILFIGSGVAGILVASRFDNTNETIIAEGHYVYADVDQVIYATEIDDREPVNSTHGIFHTPTEEDYDENAPVRHPYIIYCHYTNSHGKRKDYVVPNVWVSPYPYLERHSNQVKVYIKGNNLNRYCFDLSMFEEE